MIRPMSNDFEFFDPIPLQVADFMLRRGFRLEAPSAQLTNAPFVQILPEDERHQGHPELHLHMTTAGNAKALKYAPLEHRGDKELVLRSMREGHGHQSWRVMLYGTEPLRKDRDVLAEAVKQARGPDIGSEGLKRSKEPRKRWKNPWTSSQRPPKRCRTTPPGVLEAALSWVEACLRPWSMPSPSMATGTS